VWLHVPRELLSASVLESEGSTSGSQPPVGWSLWSTSSGKPLLRPASWPGWKKRSWHRLLSGTTSAPSTLALGVDWWISSLAEHRARTSASPGSVLGWMAVGASSSSSMSGSPSSAKLRSSSGRTLPEQLALFPESVSTSRNADTEEPGPSFAQVTLALLTNERGSSFWPTPSATPYGTNQGGGAGRTGPVRPGVDSLARAWPTPRASDGTKGGPNQRGSAGDLMLPSAAVQWPTPSARDWRSGLASEETHARNSRPLNEVASRASLQVPTTRTPGVESSPVAPISPQLNPAFVEWLMGWPEGWTLPYVRIVCAPAATESSQPKPHVHGEGSGDTCSEPEAA